MISGPIHLISSDFRQFFFPHHFRTGQSAHAGTTDFMPVETALQSSFSRVCFLHVKHAFKKQQQKFVSEYYFMPRCRKSAVAWRMYTESELRFAALDVVGNVHRSIALTVVYH